VSGGTSPSQGSEAGVRKSCAVHLIIQHVHAGDRSGTIGPIGEPLMDLPVDGLFVMDRILGNRPFETARTSRTIGVSTTALAAATRPASMAVGFSNPRTALVCFSRFLPSRVLPSMTACHLAAAGLEQNQVRRSDSGDLLGSREL
jgi:hypothetical protein